MPLKITFCLCTYNAEEHLRDCLRSIVNQEYPGDKFEILVADGGSTDSTLSILKEFGLTSFHNELKLYDYGEKIVAKYAFGDLFVVFAADNELTAKDWALRVSSIFETHPDVAALWGGMKAHEKDAKINFYYELIQSDPLMYHLNKNPERYLRKSHKHRTETDQYYQFDVKPHEPLVWGANGLVYRFDYMKDIILSDRFLADNDVFQAMIERGNNRVVYAPTLSVYHHHLKCLKEWVSKWKRNYRRHLIDKIEQRNMNWAYTPHAGVKIACWLFFSLFPLVSLFYSIWKMAQSGNKYWIYHPLACFLQAISLVYLTLSSKNGIKVLFNMIKTGNLKI